MPWPVADVSVPQTGDIALIMSLVQLHPRRPDIPAPFAPSPEALEPGRYLTDGRRLFRVVSRFDAPPETVLVVLEDCVTLDVLALVPSELGEMGVSAVPTDGPVR
jgi:hypothetical protein